MTVYIYTVSKINSITGKDQLSRRFFLLYFLDHLISISLKTQFVLPGIFFFIELYNSAYVESKTTEYFSNQQDQKEIKDSIPVLINHNKEAHLQQYHYKTVIP